MAVLAKLPTQDATAPRSHDFNIRRMWQIHAHKRSRVNVTTLGEKSSIDIIAASRLMTIADKVGWREVVYIPIQYGDSGHTIAQNPTKGFATRWLAPVMVMISCAMSCLVC